MQKKPSSQTLPSVDQIALAIKDNIQNHMASHLVFAALPPHLSKGFSRFYETLQKAALQNAAPKKAPRVFRRLKRNQGAINDRILQSLEELAQFNRQLAMQLVKMEQQMEVLQQAASQNRPLLGSWTHNAVKENH